MGGSSLPIEVYILGVADTYDAITSTRPYSYASSPERAREIILSESGKQFHPQVVEAFVLAFDKKEMTLVDRKTTEHMLQKNKLADKQLTRLKIYRGAEHNNQAQMPEVWDR